MTVYYSHSAELTVNCCCVSALGSDNRVRDCWDYSSDSKPHSYLEATRSGLQSEASASAGPHLDHQQLCPYLAMGHCHYGDSCPYLHGDLCEICRLQVLHPNDPEQRAAHEKVIEFCSFFKIPSLMKYVYACSVFQFLY